MFINFTTSSIIYTCIGEYASRIAALCFTDGIKFYYSNKFIIVFPGDEDGCLLPKYFSKAINLRSGELTIIYFAEQIHCNHAYMRILQHDNYEQY